MMIKPISTTTLALLLLGGALNAQAVPTLTLGSLNLSGNSGDTLGWGFTLTNDTVYDLSVTGVYADGTLFGSDGASALGDFADYILVWSQASGGLTVATNQSFTGTAPGTALATFAIHPDAPGGADPVTGHIYLTYDLNAGDTYSGSGTLTAQYLGLDALASVSVPAPATPALLALGLAGLARRRSARGATAVLR